MWLWIRKPALQGKHIRDFICLGFELQQRAYSPQLAAGLASESKN